MPEVYADNTNVSVDTSQYFATNFVNAKTAIEANLGRALTADELNTLGDDISAAYPSVNVQIVPAETWTQYAKTYLQAEVNDKSGVQATAAKVGTNIDAGILPGFTSSDIANNPFAHFLEGVSIVTLAAVGLLVYLAFKFAMSDAGQKTIKAAAV